MSHKHDIYVGVYISSYNYPCGLQYTGIGLGLTGILYNAGWLVRSSHKSVLCIEITLKERTFMLNGLTRFDCIHRLM